MKFELTKDQQMAELVLTYQTDEKIVECISELLEHFMNGLELDDLEINFGETLCNT